MNPFGLTATGLLVWGIVAHLVADWPLQNEWMASNKASRIVTNRRRRKWHRERMKGNHGIGYVSENAEYPGPRAPWWCRHPAAYVHAGVHGLILAPVFGWPAAAIAVVHLLIDTRVPLAWWARFYRQTTPMGRTAVHPDAANPETRPYSMDFDLISVVREAPSTEIAQVKLDLAQLKRDMQSWTVPLYDMGTEVRLWTDQVAHIAVLAVAALLTVTV